MISDSHAESGFVKSVGISLYLFRGRYTFKVGVRSMSDANAPVSYFMAGTDYAEKC